MIIIPEYDSNALAAPQSFRDGVQAAINMLDAKFTANITVKISIGYGEIGGSPLSSNFAEGFFSGTSVSYSSLRSDLDTFSTIDRNSPSLPAGTSLNGASSFVISNAEERIFGLLPAVNSTSTNDGEIGIGTGFSGNSLISVALHELTHALGRGVGSGAVVTDVFRFSSPGHRLYGNAIPAPSAYFSLDGGNTDLADYGINSDPGDFLNPPSSNRTPNDPFNEFVGNLGRLTGMDVEQMNALGFAVNIAQNDFNADGQSDLLWFNQGTGQVTIWGSNADNSFANTPNSVVTHVGSGWAPVGVGDFNGLGAADLIFQNGNTFTEWQSTINGFVPNVFVGSVGTAWFLAGVGDFSGDGMADLIWQNGGTFAEWRSTGNSFTPNVVIGSVSAGWNLAGVGDFNNDGKADLIWQNGGTIHRMAIQRQRLHA